MRESIGSTWTFMLVIAFILIFASYLTISLNYSKAFKVQNEVIDIIERSEGLTDQTSNDGRSDGGIQLIANFMRYNGYNAKGSCESDYYGATTLAGNGMEDLEAAQPGKKYYYCVRKHKGYFDKKPNRAYYDVDMFFAFDLPIIGDIFTFKVSGQTLEIEHTYDNL